MEQKGHGTKSKNGEEKTSRKQNVMYYKNTEVTKYHRTYIYNVSLSSFCMLASTVSLTVSVALHFPLLPVCPTIVPVCRHYSHLW